MQGSDPPSTMLRMVPLPVPGEESEPCPSHPLNRPRHDRETHHGRAALLEGTDQAGSGLDPGGNLFGDASGATIAFNQIHEPTGKRIKYEKVVPGIGAVDPDDIVKGFQVLRRAATSCSTTTSSRRSSWRARRRSS